MTYLLFFIGFVLLIKGADFLVDGASSIAKKFSVSSLVIGLTIVAFGTSAPELVVNILASIKGSSDIAIGNIIGSNISNTLLILGIAALIYPIGLSKGTVWKEIPLSFLALAVVFMLANDHLIDHYDFALITRIDGFILLAFFIIFLYYTFGIAKVEGGEDDIKEYKGLTSLGLVILGMLGLTYGGKWVVDGAIEIATQLGLSESLIGLTVVAVGTSLPELATSAIAAYKKSPDIAIGNIVGSNIFNLFWILGVSATIRPLTFNETLNFDIAVAAGATVLLFIFILIRHHHLLKNEHKIDRLEGGLFVLFYICYIVYLVIRG